MELSGQGNGTWVWQKSSFSGGNNNDCVEVGHWRKSSFSGGNNNSCVEVAHATEVVGVRDSKNAEGPKLAFGPTSWRGFLGDVVER